jgi:hypothetical protein
LAPPEQTRSLRGMIRAFRQMLATHRPDGVVINACGRPRFWLYPWLARWAGMPVVWVHQMVEARDHRRQRPQWFGGRMEGLQSWRVPQALRHRLAAAAATAVIVLNEEDGRRITRWQGVNPAHITSCRRRDLHEFRFSPAGDKPCVGNGPCPTPPTPIPPTLAPPTPPRGHRHRRPARGRQRHRLLIEAVGISASAGALLTRHRRRRPRPSRHGQPRPAARRHRRGAFRGFVDDMPAFYSALDIFAYAA